jgi:hypothetical protein
MAGAQLGHGEEVHGACQRLVSGLGRIVGGELQVPHTIAQSEVCQRGVGFDSENIVEVGVVPSIVVPIRTIEIVPHGCTGQMKTR